MPPSPSHLALLRGINVGGKHILPMAALAAMFEEAGCTAVKTYIQSGNVVFAATPALAKKLPTLIADRIEHKFKFRPVLIFRTRDQLAGLAAANPYLRDEEDHAKIHVGFLETAPTKQLAAALDPKRSPGDRFTLVGAELFMHFPNGAADTKLTSAYLDSTLKTTVTARNWRTVLKLVDMLNTAQ